MIKNISNLPLFEEQGKKTTLNRIADLNDFSLKNFKISDKNYLLREFRNFYNNREIAYLSESLYLLTLGDCLKKAKKVLEKAEKAKTPKKKSYYLSKELKNLINVYKLLSNLLKEKQEPKYKVLNEKYFEKGISYKKAIEISKYVFNFYHFEKFYKKVRSDLFPKNSFQGSFLDCSLKYGGRELSYFSNIPPTRKKEKKIDEEGIIKFFNIPGNKKICRSCKEFSMVGDFIVRGNLSMIPPQLPEYLPLLKKLFLTRNKIEKIFGLEKLENLKCLYLDDNRIKKIEGLNKLKLLNNLNLNNNEIKKIEGLEELKNLKWLYLNGNRIEKISGLDELKKLEWLYLNNNEIEEISGLDELKKLEWLYLECNEINKIFELKLENLECLYLKKNRIKKISGLNELKNLRNLDLGNNKIKEISGLEELGNLECLCLDDNEIKKIEGLNNLKLLKTVYLRDNKIPKDEIKRQKDSSNPFSIITD